MSLSPRRPAFPARAKADCFACQNRERSAWCGLSTADLNLLDRKKQVTAYKPGQMIYYQGEVSHGLFVVEQGSVAIRKSDSGGATMLMRLCHPGDSLGYRALLSGNRHTTSAEALSDSKVCFFSSESVKEMLMHNPELGLRFVRQLSEELETTEEHMLRSASLPVRTRVAHLLLTLKDRYGTAQDDGSLLVQLPISRQDIASLLGARPETIARTLHELESDGVVRMAGRSAIVPDLDLLLDELEFSDE